MLPPTGSGSGEEKGTIGSGRKKDEKIAKKELTKGEIAGIICKHSSRGQQSKPRVEKIKKKVLDK